MSAVKEKVAMMWGMEVAETLDAEGLLAQEVVAPAKSKVGVLVEGEPTHWLLKAWYDGVGDITKARWISQSMDSEAKSWCAALRYGSNGQPMSSPPRRFEKAWPVKSKVQASRTANMINSWGGAHGVTAKLVPAILVEIA